MAQRWQTLLVGCTLAVTTMTAAADPGFGAAALEWESVRTTNVGERVVVPDLEVRTMAGDRLITLDLERFDVLTDDARIVVGAGPAERALPRPKLVLLRGTVAGEAGSRVFVAVSPYGTNGFVEDSSGTVSISTGAFRAGARPLSAADLRAIPIDPNDTGFACAAGADPDANAFGAADDGEFVALPVGGPPCRVLRLALETDWEFTLDQGGDPNAGAAYAITLMAAGSEIYRSQLNLRLAVSFLRVYDGADDPWTATSSGAALTEVRTYWRALEDGVDRELVHFLSAKGLGGGIASLDVVCDYDNGYAVSGNLNGFFPYPLQDHSGSNWDIVVTTHELGHNIGTPHTHNYNPPLDGCGNGDCSDAFGGTIMSYCHTCSGGMSNIQLSFHPTVVSHMLADLNQVCDLVTEGSAAVDDTVSTYAGQAVIVDALQNDETVSCDDVTLVSFDATTNKGGTVELEAASAEFPRDRLRVTPGGTQGGETFYYSIGDDSAVVRVLLQPLRAPDTTGPTEPGLGVKYYALSSPSALPDFEALTPYLEDGVNLLNFASTNGNFASSGLANEVGAVFEGFVEAPVPGVYTFHVESDDGSRVLIGDDIVVNNDGLHGMVERSGDVALQAGTHRLRVEFFENGGGAGLYLRWTRPNVAKQIVPGSFLSRALPCAADIDGSGAVDFADVLSVLAAWGPCVACPEDLDGNGAVDFTDLLSVLAAWGNC